MISVGLSLTLASLCGFDGFTVTELSQFARRLSKPLTTLRDLRVHDAIVGGRSGGEGEGVISGGQGIGAVGPEVVEVVDI